jgi:hypothetical protein
MANELTEEEAGLARRAIQLVQSLSANPEARGHFERSLKVLDPKLVTTEDVRNGLTAPMQAQLDEMRKQLTERDEAEAKRVKETAEAEAVGRMEAAFGRLRAQGLTEAGETKVKEIMAERQVYDPEAAFAYFEKSNPKPAQEQSSWTPEHWNYEKESVTDTAALFGDPEKWADMEVGQVLLDERRRSGNDS